jgi:hypothetical protein
LGWDYVFGIALVVFPWIAYRFEQRKNTAAFGHTSEGILKEWELDYLTKAHLAAKHDRGDSRLPNDFDVDP